MAVSGAKNKAVGFDDDNTKDRKKPKHKKTSRQNKDTKRR